MSIWEKLFGSKNERAEGGKVTFLREERRPPQGFSTTLATYRYYKAASTEAALEFLNKQEVTGKLFYVAVETPDGRWVKDCTGFMTLETSWLPCHHSLEQYLDEYIAAAGIAGEPDAPLFQTAAGKTGTLTGKAMWQQDAYRMIQRRTRDTGIKTRIGKQFHEAKAYTLTAPTDWYVQRAPSQRSRGPFLASGRVE